jgi:phosphomannomutase
VFTQHTLARGAGDAREGGIGQIDGVQRVLRGLRQDNFAARLEEMLDALPGVAQQRCTAGSGLEQAAGRAESCRGHVCASDVERQAGGAEKSRVVGGRDMGDVPDVGCPGKVRRITGAANHEVLREAAACGLEQQPVEHGLAVRSICSEIRQRRAGVFPADHRMVGPRIDVSIQGSHTARAESLAQGSECSAAGVAENQVKIPQPAGRQVVNRLAGREARQGDRGVEIVKDVHSGGGGVETQLRRGIRVGAVGGDEGYVSLSGMVRGGRGDVVPIRVEHQLRVRESGEIPVRCVVGNVPLEEYDFVTALGECADQTTPQRRMAITPRGAEGEAENDEFHEGERARGAPVEEGQSSIGVSSVAVVPAATHVDMLELTDGPRVDFSMSAPTHHRVNPAALRAYDIRGRYGQELCLDDARALGLAYATVARAHGQQCVGVCRDGRLSSPELERSLVAGLLGGGLRVCPLGVGPTPLLYFAIEAGQLDGGIMVTGSHNPADHNGFKVLLGGEPVFGQALRELVATAPVERPDGELREFTLDGIGAASAYVTRLAAMARCAPSLEVVWDCGNGAVGAVIGALTARLPGQHTLLNDKVDGRFPGHHPDPSVPENLRELQAAVLGGGADLGIAFDGDGDRIGVVDSTGEIVWPDQLLLLLARGALQERPRTCVVADVKSSRVLFEGIARAGGRAVMAPSGYVLVRAAMLREGASLAGEMSGHIFFSDCWHATDDALFVAMRLLMTLGLQGCSLAEFRSGLPRTYTTPELRLECPEARKQQVVGEVVTRLAAEGIAVDTTDGLRVTSEDGWWLLRASGTEARLTARCEAADPAALERLWRQLEWQLRHSGIRWAVPSSLLR